MEYRGVHRVKAVGSSGDVTIIETDYSYKGLRFPVGVEHIKQGPDTAVQLIELLQEHVAWTKHPLYQWGKRKIGVCEDA